MKHLSQIFGESSQRAPAHHAPHSQPKRSRDRHKRGLLLAFLCCTGSVLFLKAPIGSLSQGMHLHSLGAMDWQPSSVAIAQVVPAEVVVSRDAVLRSRPSPAGRVSGQATAGSHATLLDRQPGDDGNLWYYLQFSNQRGWLPASLVSEPATETPAQLPNPTAETPTSPAPDSSGSPQTTALPNPQFIPRNYNRTRQRLGLGNPPPAPPPATPVAIVNPVDASPATPAPTRLTQEQIDYFLEIALGSEWGSSGTIRRWNQNLRIQVLGNPTQQDRATLQTVIAELNDLVGDSIQLELVDQNPNVEIHFAPESQFGQIEPNYRPRNMGFFWTRWGSNGINNARILISTTGVTQAERSHLIREELTQALGLMRDSYRYADSIFYQGWTEVGSYSALDRTLIQLLYSGSFQHGMTREDAMQVLSRL